MKRWKYTVPTAIIDACALINLDNSGAAALLMENLPLQICCQGLVEDELFDRSPTMQHLFNSRIIRAVRGDIAAVEVSQLVVSHRIGLGEAECIAFCLREGWGLISDDHRARQVARKKFGQARVTGTIGILNECIDSGVITGAEADRLLTKARLAGGFLPNYDFDSRRIAI